MGNALHRYSGLIIYVYHFPAFQMIATYFLLSILTPLGLPPSPLPSPAHPCLMTILNHSLKNVKQAVRISFSSPKLLILFPVYHLTLWIWNLFLPKAKLSSCILDSTLRNLFLWFFPFSSVINVLDHFRDYTLPYSSILYLHKPCFEPRFSLSLQ